jgi:hypothetical protein
MIVGPDEALMGQEGSPHRHRDWSLLQPDLIALILGALELPDLLASAAACRSWRAADPRIDAASFFRGPCLVFCSGVNSDAPASEASLRSLTDGAGGRVHRVTLPDPPFATRYVMGSSHGWLATADEKSDLLLVNPVTRAHSNLHSEARHVPFQTRNPPTVSGPWCGFAWIRAPLPCPGKP